MANEDKTNLTAEGNRAAQRAAIQKAKDDARRAKLKPRVEDEEEDDYVPSRFSLAGIRSGMTGGAWKAVLMLLIFIFAVGSFLVGGGPTPEAPTGNTGTNTNAPETVATAAGQNISRTQLDRALQQQLQYASYFGQTPTAADWFGFKQRALQGLQSNAAVVKAAQDANTPVSEKDIDDKVSSLITQQVEQQSGGNMANFRRTLEAQGKTEDGVRQAMRADYDRELVRNLLLTERFEKSWKAANKVTEADYLASVTQLNLSQIVVRAKPPLPNDKNALATYTKNKAEAQTRAQKIADGLKNLDGNLTAKFAQLARTQSDDLPTKTKGGALGFKLPAEVPFSPATRDAILAVKNVPALVGPLQDDAVGGSVLLLVAGKKPQLPKDYAKNKAKLFAAFEEQRDAEAWQKYVETISKAAPLEMQDAALKAFKTQTDSALSLPANSNNDARNGVLGEYERALTYSHGLEAAAIRFQMAQLYGAMKQPDKQIAALQEAVKDVPNASIPLHLELARVLAGTKRNAEAVKELQAASKEVDNAPTSSSQFGGNPNDQMRAQIAAQFESIGRRDLAALERAKVKPAVAPGAVNGAGSGKVFTIPGGANR